ncbi:TPA: S24 family peptidase [Klebsiella pneumoniae]|nr:MULTISPECIES: S24 family peptidase [Klebsiella]MDN4892982.1 S24 family peptidase [Klebsiella pneumoniae]
MPAGFPSPAAGYEKQDLNLHEYCVRHPSATYFLRVEGNSMEDARIHDGDVLVVDRALEPEHGSIVIAAVDNEVSDTLDLREFQQQQEKDFLQTSLQQAKFNQKKAAELLGLTYHQLRALLKKHQI